tara:strand:+ start:38 stop:265 length:228 start_codon:yes stop_codon:yes gene_type:complete
MEMSEYRDSAENQRLVLETEIRLAKRKARRDYQHAPLEFLNPEVHVNPYVGESVEMEQAYTEERLLILSEIKGAR